jgi:hypothetical protein
MELEVDGIVSQLDGMHVNPIEGYPSYRDPVTKEWVTQVPYEALRHFLRGTITDLRDEYHPR